MEKGVVMSRITTLKNRLSPLFLVSSLISPSPFLVLLFQGEMMSSDPERQSG